MPDKKHQSPRSIDQDISRITTSDSARSFSGTLDSSNHGRYSTFIGNQHNYRASMPSSTRDDGPRTSAQTSRHIPGIDRSVTGEDDDQVGQRSAHGPLQSVNRRSQVSNADIETSRGALVDMRPFEISPRFVGRNTLIEGLWGKLFKSKTRHRAALVGLGGVGKTQVVIHFLEKVAYEHPEYAILWVNARDIQGFRKACLEIVKKLRIPQAGNYDDDDICMAVKRYLDGCSRKWIYVLDGADEEALLVRSKGNTTKAIVDFLPNTDGTKDHVMLVTCRHKQAAILLGCDDTFPVSRLSTSDAVSLCRSYMVPEPPLSELEDEMLRKFVRVLAHLPQAIIQASVLLSAKDYSVARYLELFHGSEQDKQELLRQAIVHDIRYTDQLDICVMDLWNPSFAQIRKTEPEAADYLQLMSLLQPTSIPYSLLPPLEPAARMHHAIATLKTYDFLTIKGDKDVTISVNPLVHIAAGAWRNHQGRTRDLRYQLLVHLVAIFSDNNPSRDRWQSYLPHAMHLVMEKDAIQHTETHVLCQAIADCLREDDRHEEAIDYLSRSVRGMAHDLEAGDAVLLSAQQDLARTYIACGKGSSAVKILDGISAVIDMELNRDHPIRLENSYLLAQAYNTNGRPDDARSVLSQEIRQTKSEPDKYADHLAECSRLLRAVIASRKLAMRAHDQSDTHKDGRTESRTGSSRSSGRGRDNRSFHDSGYAVLPDDIDKRHAKSTRQAEASRYSRNASVASSTDPSTVSEVGSHRSAKSRGKIPANDLWDRGRDPIMSEDERSETSYSSSMSRRSYVSSPQDPRPSGSTPMWDHRRSKGSRDLDPLHEDIGERRRDGGDMHENRSRRHRQS